MPLKGIACRVSRHRPAASSGLQSGARQMCRRSSHMRNCCRCLQDAAEELAAALSPDFRDRFLLLASFAFKVPALAGAADTSQVSPSGYKPWPSTDWQRIAVRHLYEPCADPMLRHLCAVRGNPRLLVCGIPVPLNGASAGVRQERGDASKRRFCAFLALLARFDHRKHSFRFLPVPGNAYSDPKHIRKASR